MKLQAFLIAGAIAGVGGAVLVHSLELVTPADFAPQSSIDVVALAVLGGIAVLHRPLLGALYVIALPAFIPLDSAALATSSVGWLLLVLYVPGGLASVLGPLRRRLFGQVRPETGQPGSATPEYSPAEAEGPATAVDEEKPDPERRPVRTGGTLELQNVSKSYGGVRAVDDVSPYHPAGRVIAQGGPEDVRRHPAVVSAYLGADEHAIARSGPSRTPTIANEHTIRRPVRQRTGAGSGRAGRRVRHRLRPGQIVAVEAAIGHEQLARATADAAYARGARYVAVQYYDPQIRRARLLGRAAAKTSASRRRGSQDA